MCKLSKKCYDIIYILFTNYYKCLIYLQFYSNLCLFYKQCIYFFYISVLVLLIECICFYLCDFYFSCRLPPVFLYISLLVFLEKGFLHRKINFFLNYLVLIKRNAFSFVIFIYIFFFLEKNVKTITCIVS